MPKLDVRVGDEFPTEENRRSEIHHHHYYYRRRPGRLLRILLTIALVGLVVRAINMVTDIGYWNMPMHGFSPYLFGGVIGLIVVLGTMLWFLRARPGDDEIG